MENARQMLQQRCTVRARHGVGTAARAIAAWLCGTALSVAAAVSGNALLLQDPPPASGVASSAPGEWLHAYAAFGQPKYPRGFHHFEYVNPDAPRGGTLYLANPDRRTAFDKYNPFTVRGASPAGLELFMLETLMVNSADEPMTMYGLLAEELKVAPEEL